MASKQIRKWLATNESIGHRPQFVKSVGRNPLSGGSSVSSIAARRLVSFPKPRRKFKVIDDDPTSAFVAKKKPAPPPLKLKDDLFASRPQVTPIVKSAIAIPSLRKSSAARLPPSLLKWAVDRGIKRGEPPPPRRPEVSALVPRRQVYEALRRGEWCYADEIPYFSSRLKEWLKHCRVRLLRHEGGGRVTVSGTPVNGYVTEDGVTFYVAEDGVTFYVQES